MPPRSHWALVGMPDGVKVRLVRLPDATPNNKQRRQTVRSHGFMPSRRGRMLAIALAS